MAIPRLVFLAAFFCVASPAVAQQRIGLVREDLTVLRGLDRCNAIDLGILSADLYEVLTTRTTAFVIIDHKGKHEVRLITGRTIRDHYRGNKNDIFVLSSWLEEHRDVVIGSGGEVECENIEAGSREVIRVSATSNFSAPLDRWRILLVDGGGGGRPPTAPAWRSNWAMLAPKLADGHPMLACGSTDRIRALYQRGAAVYEVGHGAAFGTGSDAEYSATARLTGDYFLNRGGSLRAGFAPGVQYFRSKFDLFLGARASWAPFGAVPDMRIVGEGALLPLRDTTRYLIGGALEYAFGSIRFTLRFSRDPSRKVNFFETAIGFDVFHSFRSKQLGGGDAAFLPSLGNAKDPFIGLYGYLRSVAVRVSIESTWLCDMKEAEDLERAREAAREILAPANESSPGSVALASVDSLDVFLRARNLDLLADTIREAIEAARARADETEVEIPDLTNPVHKRQEVQAVVRGWIIAMGG